jgi:hypothetical protein
MVFIQVGASLQAARGFCLAACAMEWCMQQFIGLAAEGDSHRTKWHNIIQEIGTNSTFMFKLEQLISVQNSGIVWFNSIVHVGIGGVTSL